MTNDQTVAKTIDTIRLLSADAIQKANSGHPGMPMGCADFAFTLWNRYLRHSPSNPKWLGRDRFVLSAGHGSALLYSLLHLFGYDLSLDDLKQFRQWGSKTPGHPEYGQTPGVEVTTGPLGSGLASAVGMAMSSKQLQAKMGDNELFNQRIFVISSDGCMQEGTSHEAASLAGHQQLDNLVVFYDSNSITIEGDTNLAFSEDVGKRFEAYGWKVLKIDAHNLDEINNSLQQTSTNKPTLIIGRTTIGFGSPGKSGSADSHGAPLGADELAATKINLGFDPDKSFQVADEVYQLCDLRKKELDSDANKWEEKLCEFRKVNSKKAEELDQLFAKNIPANLLEELLKVIPKGDTATRSSGGAVMQKAAELIPSLCGGTADLSPSTKAYLNGYSNFTPDNRDGRNFFFGIREMAMGLAANGMALYGTAIPFTSTFTVFCDYMKPAMRLAAIQKLHQVYVFTHDSISVGEDGATHQPIEHLMMLRSIPNLMVIRPAESHETAHAWAAALQADQPVALFLTRQTVANFAEEAVEKIDLAKGAYILDEDEDFDYILIATGSEVNLALETSCELRKQGKKVRVVSMPCWELFEKQSQEYKDAVLPSSCRQRVTIEAGTTFGWQKYSGFEGLNIGIDHFGHSAPFQVLLEKYGLTADAISKRIITNFS